LRIREPFKALIIIAAQNLGNVGALSCAWENTLSRSVLYSRIASRKNSGDDHPEQARVCRTSPSHLNLGHYNARHSIPIRLYAFVQ